MSSCFLSHGDKYKGFDAHHIHKEHHLKKPSQRVTSTLLDLPICEALSSSVTSELPRNCLPRPTLCIDHGKIYVIDTQHMTVESPSYSA